MQRERSSEGCVGGALQEELPAYAEQGTVPRNGFLESHVGWGSFAEGRREAASADVSQVTPCIDSFNNFLKGLLLWAKLCSTSELTFCWGEAVKQQ